MMANIDLLTSLSERLKLTIQSFRIENKELKKKVMELQQELSKSSLKISANLGEDLTSNVKTNMISHLL